MSLQDGPNLQMRLGIVLVLAAAEVFLLGVMAASFHGTPFATHSSHHLSFNAQAIAPLDAGTSPVITVDDPHSRVSVVLSPDGLVHVRDLTNVSGWGRASIAQLHVSRTHDGVRIERPAGNGNVNFFVLGFSARRIEIAVPRTASIAIEQCAGADIADVDGDVRVRSLDGRVSLARTKGVLDVTSDDGSIAVADAHAARLRAETNDGRIELNDVDAQTVDVRTHDGSIHINRLATTGGSVRTDDGSIHVGLTSSDLRVTAHTDNGSIRIDGKRIGADGDSDAASIAVGSGSGNLSINSGDGSIAISTNGVSS